jgi:hypothetical protein
VCFKLRWFLFHLPCYKSECISCSTYVTSKGNNFASRLHGNVTAQTQWQCALWDLLWYMIFLSTPPPLSLSLSLFAAKRIVTLWISPTVRQTEWRQMTGCLINSECNKHTRNERLVRESGWQLNSSLRRHCGLQKLQFPWAQWGEAHLVPATRATTQYNMSHFCQATTRKSCAYLRTEWVL